jgi:hypothetical protein
MDSAIRYTVRDQYGNLYGPANAEMLRQWVAEGRIVAGMTISTEGAADWHEVATHQALADLFSAPISGAPAAAFPAAAVPISGTPISSVPATPVELGYAQPPGRNTLALASFILGLVSFPCTICCCSFICIPSGIAAVVFGLVALNQIRTAHGASEGKWMAVWGIALGAVGALLCFVAFAVIFISGLLNAGGGR